MEEFTTALKKWEEDYKEANGGVAWLNDGNDDSHDLMLIFVFSSMSGSGGLGGAELPRRVEGIALHRHSKESDVMLFHLLFPAGTPDVKANITKGLPAMLRVHEHRKDHSNYMQLYGLPIGNL